VTVYRPNLYNAMYLYGVALNACVTFGFPEFTRSGKLMLTCFKHQIVPGLLYCASNCAFVFYVCIYTYVRLDWSFCH